MTPTPLPGEPVGLIPAAGLAMRLGALPCSKEILPIGRWEEGTPLAGETKVACHYLIERFRLAGVRRVHVVLRPGKGDIPAFLGSGRALGVRIGYHVTEVPHGPAYSLDEAHPFVKDELVVTGFPDLIFDPADAFVRLLEKQTATGADVVLGLFPTTRPQAMDMVRLDEDGRVLDIEIKPEETDLEYTWIIVAWTPPFTAFMHEYLGRTLGEHEDDEVERPEAHVGEVIRAGIGEGMGVRSEVFAGGRFVDVGAPEGLARELAGGSA